MSEDNPASQVLGGFKQGHTEPFANAVIVCSQILIYSPRYVYKMFIYFSDIAIAYSLRNLPHI